MSIILFAMIGSALQLGPLYWVCWALYSAWHATLVFGEVISILNSTEEEPMNGGDKNGT